MSDIFYSEDGIIVRRSTKSDVVELAPRMRQSDIQEVWASHHYLPEQALRHSLDDSILALTVENNGEVVAMFGICAESVLGENAAIWLLASDELEKIKIRFLKHSRQFIDLMLCYYPNLMNHVDSRNKESIAWLKFCGAKIHDAQPFGIDQLPFHFFTFTKEK